jgi:hypothetical protein
MKSLIVLGMLFCIFSGEGIAQRSIRGQYSFEKVSWGQKLDDVNRILSGYRLREMDRSKGGLLSKSSANSKMYVYEDTLFGSKATITLSFGNEDIALKSIVAGFFWKEEEVSANESEKIWKGIKEYYPGASNERDVMGYGLGIKWKSGNTEFMAMKINSRTHAVMLMLAPAE